MRVRGGNRGRVNIAAVACHRPGYRSRFFCHLHVWHGDTGEPESFTWQEYRDLIVRTHLQAVIFLWWNDVKAVAAAALVTLLTGGFGNAAAGQGRIGAGDTR